jgi:hypothetical protein
VDERDEYLHRSERQKYTTRDLQFRLKKRMEKNYLLGIGSFDALWFDDVQSIERITDGDQGEIRERSTI